MKRWSLGLAALVLAAVGTFAVAQNIVVPPNRAAVLVAAPINASVTFNGVATRSTGSLNHFQTQDLAPGNHTYTIEAVWTENGKEVRQTRKVQVSPGRATVVDFFVAEKSAPKVDVKKEEPKKVDVKKEEPKKVDVKKEEPKKVDVKKEEPKKVDVKKEEPKKVDVKKEEPKKVDVKKEEPKKVDVKKEEPKKVETKKEEPKKADTKDSKDKKKKKDEDKKDDKTSSSPKQRSFEFVYGGMLKELKPGAEAKVWLPVAETTREQTVAISEVRVPGKHQFSKEPVYGNKILFF